MNINKRAMTKVEAVKIFKSQNEAFLKSADKTAIRTEWNMWTDSLSRDGYITEKQRFSWTSPFN